MFSFANTNNKEIFAIHGGGNIGLGVMADIVSHSFSNYRIVATSNDKFLQNIVNSTHQCWLKHTGYSEVTNIQNVKIIPRNFVDVVKLYKEASILAICLTPAAMQTSAKAIAQGLVERYYAKQKHLNVLVLMNLPDCGEVVRKTVAAEINSLLNNSAEEKKVCDSVKFISTVVDRIVTKIPEKEIKTQLMHQLLSCISMDFIDKNWLIQQITAVIDNPEQLANAIKKLNLQVNMFNAEKSFALYAPNQIPELLQFPAIKIVNNLKQLEAIKNKYINGPHAIMAWLGNLLGCKTIASAIKYPGMKKFIETMMDKEITPVLLTEYSELTSNDLIFFKELFFERCEESIDDPVERVGRDPLRKINSGDRVRGTLELMKHHNLNLPISCLTSGIAAAILYAVKQMDPNNPECTKIHEIYSRRNSYIDVLCYHGPYSSGIFAGLDKSGDIKLMTNILNKIEALEKILEMPKVYTEPLSLLYKHEFSTKKVMQQLCIKPPATLLTKNVTLEETFPNYANAPKHENATYIPNSAILPLLSSRHSQKTSRETLIEGQSYRPNYRGQ